MPSVIPTYWSDTFRRGADYSEPFVLRVGGANGDPVDLTGATVTITVTPRDSAPRVFRSTDASPKVTHNGAGGTITFVLTEADTAGFPAGGHRFELRVAFADGTTNDYIDGTLGAEGGS